MCAIVNGFKQANKFIETPPMPYSVLLNSEHDELNGRIVRQTQSDTTESSIGQYQTPQIVRPRIEPMHSQ